MLFRIEINTRTPAFGEGERAERNAIAKALQQVIDRLSTGAPLEPVEMIRDNSSGEYIDVGEFSFGQASEQAAVLRKRAEA